jgi:hypothetical protein
MGAAVIAVTAEVRWGSHELYSALRDRGSVEPVLLPKVEPGHPRAELAD